MRGKTPSPHSLPTLQALTTGPTIQFDLVQAGGAQTVAADRDLSRPLQEAAADRLPATVPDREALLQRLEALQDQYQTAVDTVAAAVQNIPAGERMNPANSALTGIHTEAQDKRNRLREFSRLLDRLAEMSDYRNIATRPFVQAQVVDVLTAVLTSEKAREKILDAARTALGTCGDRVGEGW